VRFEGKARRPYEFDVNIITRKHKEGLVSAYAVCLPIGHMKSKRKLRKIPTVSALIEY